MSTDSSPPPQDPSAKINLLERFPTMRPVKSAPTLMTVNGFGVGMYGRRQEDPETGAYIKTQCLCLLFVPVFSLGAFRVVDSREGGWYFLGRESLSTFAKMWNALMVCLFLTGGIGIAWNAHVHSPEYMARRDLQTAAAKLQGGDGLGAAELFGKLLTGPASAEARPGLQSALEQCLKSSSLKTNEAGFRLLARLGSAVNRPAPLVPEAFARGLKRIEEVRAQNPDGALRLLTAVAGLDPKNEAIAPLRIELLQAVIAAQPDNLDAVVELALVYEQGKQVKESHALLRPYQAKLGSTEGARILGEQLLHEGQYEDAYGLLHPYVQVRLTKLHAVERSYTNAVGASYRAALEHLRSNQADRSFYVTYQQSTKEEQEKMVDKFVQMWMKNDATYQRALAQLQEANQIVNVTLDLGIVQLNRAQSFQDSARRQSELEAAEKTFLAIRGLAGETDEYRLFLGQVYYWLGRAAEGKELFDQLLASKKRAYGILMSLGRTLREVGEEKQARELLEEAYRNGQVGRERFQAAASRAVLARDVGDKIGWLEKADPNEPATQVALNGARGEQALEQGRKEAAAGFLRKTIAGYDAMTRSAGVLNNKGLAYLALSEATGEAADLNRGLSLLEEAVALEPGNSILLVNTTQILVSRALHDLFRDQVRLDLIKETPDLDLLGLLYDSEAERKELFQKLRAHESLKKALTYLDRALLLSPKTRNLYRQQLYFQAAFQDVAELQKLKQRLQNAQINEADLSKEAQPAWSGAKDQEYRERFQNQIRRFESLQQSPAVQQHPATLEYVSVSLNNVKLMAIPYGVAVDAQPVLDSALSLYQKHPVAATRRSLVSAYSQRALQDLSRQNPDLASLIRSTSHSLAPRYLLAFWLEQGGPAASLVRQNPHVQKLLALEKEAGRRFASWRDATDWAMFRATDPEEAARVVDAFNRNTTARLVDELQFELAPVDADTVLEHYWTCKIKGDQPAALARYQKGLRLGVPLPPVAGAPAASTGKLANKD